MDAADVIKMYGEQTCTAASVEDEPVFLYLLSRARSALDAAAKREGRDAITNTVKAQLFIEREPSVEAREYISAAGIQVVTPHEGFEDMASQFARLVVTADCAPA